jgi:hypothetical protein
METTAAPGALLEWLEALGWRIRLDRDGELFVGLATRGGASCEPLQVQASANHLDEVELSLFCEAAAAAAAVAAPSGSPLRPSMKLLAA